jgi:hypothetical protein
VPSPGGCTLTDTIDALGKAARDGAGRHVCLDRLEHELAGTQVLAGIFAGSRGP